MKELKARIEMARGAEGQPGEDGFSPTVEVEDIAGGHRIIITDVQGSKTFDVLNGDANIPVPEPSDVDKFLGVENGAYSLKELPAETDPTVPDWAKQPSKPKYTAKEVGADASGTATTKIAAHNVETQSHNDIRLLIEELTTRLNALADSENVDLDQLSEIITYIQDNRELIDVVTTSKVGYSDIVNNLVTNVSGKPLSAAQGVVLKALIDAITVPTKLSELEDDSTHRLVTDTEKQTWSGKSSFSGKYEDLSGKPTIPSKTSQLTNDSGYVKDTLTAGNGTLGLVKTTSTTTSTSGLTACPIISGVPYYKDTNTTYTTTSSVTSGSTALLTSGGAYTALSAKAAVPTVATSYTSAAAITDNCTYVVAKSAAFTINASSASAKYGTHFIITTSGAFKITISNATKVYDPDDWRNTACKSGDVFEVSVFRGYVVIKRTYAV